METRTPAPAHPGAHAFPVSVKGVAVQGGRVLLLENERNEWELPGGKLELREDPADCVVREIREEAGWKVTAGPLLDCWQYHIREGADVVIVTYGCHVLSTDPPLVSNEHKQAGLFAMSEIPDLVMPDGYKRSIAAWSARLATTRPSEPSGNLGPGWCPGWTPNETSRRTRAARRIYP
jgi:8-oxo-dGTP pyrophosphatase MutT (NUDIX family)